MIIGTGSSNVSSARRRPGIFMQLIVVLNRANIIMLG
jgi:hypothetical protein